MKNVYKKIKSNEVIRIIIGDSRETKCNRLLQDKKASIKVEFLEVGDHLLPNSFAVERKKGRDLLNSVADKRIYKQLNNLYQYDYPILAIVTNDIWEDLYHARNTRNQNIYNVYNGVLYTIYCKYPKVRVLFFKDDDKYTDWLIEMDTRLSSDSKSLRPVPLMRRPINNRESMENFLCACPGIAVKSSKILLKTYHSIENLCNAEIEDIQNVRGIGKKTAEKLYKLLHGVYEEN